MLAFVSLAIEETAGVGGEVSAVGVIVQNAAGVVLEGGAHIPGPLRSQLPATMRLAVTFRDDRGNTTTTVVSVEVL